ncbi:FAD-binding oxidoreductase [Desulfopila sp. IMCC35008]|uniref:FAD-binding oxidoreductase n=1 Tax=Desulfopila sp. IMCC35008 TaxID=2653858 RepID=UPI0013D1B632|nr:FAD-linked oxidase C-terminal domain-containing protein [Desulfopila sp. IMCC35008]
MLREDVKNTLIKVVGAERYLDRIEELACYGYDSYLEESLPEAVIFPLSTEEVAAILPIAGKHKIPVTARGAGTSVCGAPIPIQKGIVLCFSKMNRVLELNTQDRYAVVEPGVVNGDLQKNLTPLGFFYPPDPGSINISTIGGNVALNAGGPRCLKYGVTMDYVLGMEVVLPSGKVVNLGSKNIKDVTGYKLSALFCGSEGTLGIITKIILRVVPLPETARTIMVSFGNLDNSAQAVSDIIGSGILPVAMELMDKVTISEIEDTLKLGLDTEAEGTLLIEVDGMAETCEREMARIKEKVKEHGAVSLTEAATADDRENLWKARRFAYPVFAKIGPDIITEDVTVPVSQVPSMVRKIREILNKYKVMAGILAHAGDGNMHPLIPVDRSNPEEMAKVHRAIGEIFQAAIPLEGTLSGEHGIGLAKSEYLPLVMDENTREFMTVIKRAVDPDNILNPGKFV